MSINKRATHANYYNCSFVTSIQFEDGDEDVKWGLVSLVDFGFCCVSLLFFLFSWIYCVIGIGNFRLLGGDSFI